MSYIASSARARLGAYFFALAPLFLGAAGCRGPSADACLEAVSPLLQSLAGVAQAHSACVEDADCAAHHVDLPCADICPVAARADAAAALAAEVEAQRAQCPDCAVESLCIVQQPYCNAGACDLCAQPARVRDGAQPDDLCWAPPQAWCSGDLGAEPVRGCRADGSLCCTFVAGCVPCAWTDCDASPQGPGCLGGANPTGACPEIPLGTFCLDDF